MTHTADLPENNSPSLISKHRVEALADGLFAIVMTLLVLELRVPDLARGVSAPELLQALQPLLRVLFSFFVTFVLASNYWMTQQAMFNATIRIDRPGILFNLCALMFVSLLPFSTALLGHYLGNSVAVVTYFGNQFAIALFLIIYWTWIRRSRNVHPLDAASENKIASSVYISAAGCLSASIVGIFAPHQSFNSFIIVVMAARFMNRRMKAARAIA